MPVGSPQALRNVAKGSSQGAHSWGDPEPFRRFGCGKAMDMSVKLWNFYRIWRDLPGFLPDFTGFTRIWWVFNNIWYVFLCRIYDLNWIFVMGYCEIYWISMGFWPDFMVCWMDLNGIIGFTIKHIPYTDRKLKHHCWILYVDYIWDVF